MEQKVLWFFFITSRFWCASLYNFLTDCCFSVCVQVHTLEVFQKELNESEHLVFQAVHSLQRALQGDYRDVVNMKESSRQRLEALREAAIKVSSDQQCFMDTISLCRREELMLYSVSLSEVIWSVCCLHTHLNTGIPQDDLFLYVFFEIFSK